MTILLILLAGITGLSLGLKYSRDGLIRLRRPLQHRGVLIAWVEPPLSTWQEDGLVGAAMTFTTTGLLVLGMLAGMGGVRDWLEPWAWLSGRYSFLHHASILLSIWLVWYLIGADLGFHLFNMLLRPLRKGVAPEGVFSGQQFMSWQQLSHYVEDDRSGMIRLFASKSPEVPVFVFKPGRATLYQGLLQVLAGQLPQTPTKASLPWRRRKASLAFGLVAASFLPALCGLWLFHQRFLMAWALQALLAWLALFISARLLQSISGNHSPVPESSDKR